MKTITDTIEKDVNNLFGALASHLVQAQYFIDEIECLMREVEDTIDPTYLSDLRKDLRSLEEQMTRTDFGMGDTMYNVDKDIKAGKLKTADRYYDTVISPHNESMVKFYYELGSLEAFKAYLKEHDPLAFDDEEDAEDFWKFAVEDRYYEKHKTYKVD